MINPIAYSYWRRIKAGAREFSKTPQNIKADVLQVARNACIDSKITVENFEKLFGEKF